jgi:two-component system phosphate regulon sensor histidine kinase PhoR
MFTKARWRLTLLYSAFFFLFFWTVSIGLYVWMEQSMGSDVSHELRTPLAIMSGEIEVALKKDRSQKDYQHTLTSVKEETDRLTGLVENVLLLARMEQGTLARAREAVDLTDLINQVLGACEQQRQEKHIAVHIIPAEESVVVIGQEALLRQVFFNILENAIKYTPEQGMITLELAQEKQYGIVKVTDTGVGIAPEHQARIFDRFYRIDAARSETKGYGLGLAIVQAIVALHHGTIQVHSAVGQGTTFVLAFPRA